VGDIATVDMLGLRSAVRKFAMTQNQAALEPVGVFYVGIERIAVERRGVDIHAAPGPWNLLKGHSTDKYPKLTAGKVLPDVCCGA